MLLRKVLFAGSAVLDTVVTPQLSTVNLNASVFDPSDAVCGVRLLSDGTLQFRQGTSSVAWSTRASEWATPRTSGIGSLYEVQMLTTSGGFSSGPSGWVSLGSTRTWELLRSTDGQSSFSGTLQVRRSGAVVASASVTMNSEVQSATIRLDSKNVFAQQFGATATASAAIRLLSDGTLQTRNTSPGGAFVSDSDEWALPRMASNGSSYQVLLVKTSGADPTGTLNTWLPLTSTQSWDLTQFNAGSRTFQGTMSIRTTSGTVVDSAPVTLTASVESISN